MHEIYNFFYKFINQKNNVSNLQENYIKILQIMMPIVPHMTNECLSEFVKKDIQFWPVVNKKYLQTKKNNIVIQINGKKRALLLIEESINEKELIKKVKKIKEIEKILFEKEIIKTIFIKDKLINLIIK